jgi:predicted GH43/DUF377 family glycosyl hydrolase
MEIALDDADLIATDARVVRYKGVDYLTTLSHLRLLCSDDGVHFHEPEGYNKLFGTGPLQTFGIEDCRVTCLEGQYYLTFTAVSDSGVGVGMRTTTDWKSFQTHGMILPPHNKDVAIFEEKINGLYYACTAQAAWILVVTISGLPNRLMVNTGVTTNALLKPAKACGMAVG